MAQDNNAQQANGENTEGKTPLEIVKEQQDQNQQNLTIAHQQQGMKQQSQDVENQRVETDEEVPGRSVPSDIRHHPQRIKY